MVYLLAGAPRAAALSAVPDAAMTAGDDGARQGSFFGRRKGHKLRAHQADLVENLLPHPAPAIAGETPADISELFDPKADDLRLEIGFGGGEHLVAEAQSFAGT